MPAGRPCTICKSPEAMQLATKMVAAGASDQDIADKLGMTGTSGRMRVARHRQKHIEAPARALAIAADKGHSVMKQRKAIEAGELDDTASFLALDAITRDARGISKDLKKARKATKKAGQYSIMAGVVAQEHKSLHLRGVLGNHVGFIPQKLSPAEAGGVPFNLTINLTGREPMRIGGTPMEQIPGPGSGPMIDATPAAVEIPAAPAEQVDGSADGIDDILDCVFNRPTPAVAEEIEPAPAPRRGRPRRS